MKKVTLLTFILLAHTIFAQTEKPNYITVSAQFETLYNAADYKAIFDLYSPEMKIALPLQETTQFLSSIQAEAGKINKREFIKFDRTYAVYKTTFEKKTASVNISIDNNFKINGLSVKPYTDQSLPKPERNKTRLTLPFKGEWTVTWGGDTAELNYHVESEAQKNAFDFLITDNKGRSYKTNGNQNEDYYAFAKELSAPCDGEVVLTVDGIKDNSPGTANPIYIPGNTVIIKTINNEYLFFAHFKQNSIRVKQGQKIKQGEILGLCGNSGNSSEPHLHFHIQNIEDMNIATGIKCYFDKITVNNKPRSDYSPIKNDKIKTE